MKKFEPPVEEVGKILGNPKYLGIFDDEVKLMVLERKDESKSAIQTESAISTTDLSK